MVYTSMSQQKEATTRVPKMLIPKPVFAIFSVLIMPVPNTIALGAVATGNMKAQLALSAAGTISSSGSISVEMAVAASMGISSVVVAVLLVISVRNVTIRQMHAIIRNIGSVDTLDSWPPIA